MSLLHVTSFLAALSGSGAAVLAQIPSPQVISEWGQLSGMAILGCICLVMGWFSYKAQLANAQSVRDVAKQMGDLTAELKQRPCVRDPKNN